MILFFTTIQVGSKEEKVWAETTATKNNITTWNAILAYYSITILCRYNEWFTCCKLRHKSLTNAFAQNVAATFSLHDISPIAFFPYKKLAILGNFFRLFNTVGKQMFNIKLPNDSIRIADLWCCNWPLNQLSHNHCPTINRFYYPNIPNLLLYNVRPNFYH